MKDQSEDPVRLRKFNFSSKQTIRIIMQKLEKANFIFENKEKCVQLRWNCAPEFKIV